MLAHWQVKVPGPVERSRRTHDIESLLTFRCGVGELIVAGRDFSGAPETRPVVQLNRSVRGTQSGEVEAGRISKGELESASLEFRRLRQEKRRRFRGSNWIVKLGGRTGVGVIKTSHNQNLPVGEQRGKMVATPADQRPNSLRMKVPALPPSVPVTRM